MISMILKALQTFTTCTKLPSMINGLYQILEDEIVSQIICTCAFRVKFRIRENQLHELPFQKMASKKPNSFCPVKENVAKIEI